MIIYLHDTKYEYTNEVAANRHNIDTIDQIDKFLENHPSTILSADDGYKSVFNLLPLLDKHETKLLFFITTGFIDKTIYPYEVELSNFLERNGSCVLNYEELECQSLKQKEEIFKKIHSDLKYKNYRQRERFMNQFAEDNNFSRETYQQDFFMTWNDIIEIAKHPKVEVGSHTVSHIALPFHSLRTIYKELKGSKQILEAKIGKNISKFSYPYGANNRKVRMLTRLCGYKQAYSTKRTSSSSVNIGRHTLDEFYD